MSRRTLAWNCKCEDCESMAKFELPLKVYANLNKYSRTCNKAMLSFKIYSISLW